MPCAALVQALGLPLRTASLPTLLGAGLQRGEASLEETGYVLRSIRNVRLPTMAAARSSSQTAPQP